MLALWPAMELWFLIVGLSAVVFLVAAVKRYVSREICLTLEM